jgi:hypothetical protein
MEDKKKSFKKYFEFIPDWFIDGSESVFWNILGNLIPIWFGLAINIYEFGFDWSKVYDAIHQPYTFLILSASYLTTTFYIINRKGSFNYNKYFHYIFIILLMIIGYIIKDRKSLEDVSASFNKEFFVVIIFIISFFMYLYYEYKSHKDIEDTNSKKESIKQFDDLKDSFKNFNNNG